MATGSSYEERAVRGDMGAWSPCVWTRRAGDEAARIVPDGCVDLIWMRGRLEIAGPDSAHREVALGPGEPITGVRLRPGAARVLLGETPASEVRDAQPALTEVWGTAASRLEDRVGGEPDPWRVAGHLAQALHARAARFAPDPVAVAVAEALDRPRPPAIGDMAWEFGYSERQLRRRVIAAVGYGPKTLEQILRFRRTAALAEDGPDWARLAAEQGYADQAHLSRQMRRWSGRPPRELVVGAPA
ncbi:helix-turn-helix domain-containing protein [Glycomyces harbinensis]|uniref:AraC-type DNA-binding protein n=1 Tax=Glycomyces harbinensis TaxID=58114 RepID=A0A1G6VZ42_9ACTN|nr:AraC family transcriptional regulator [Glycomyces harbinensis]SDD58990.1 AraC-type DNA-binding protein [Glycomyces harbinensis]